MSAALTAMAFAAIEAEIAHRRQLAGDLDGRQRHGGWALIIGGVALYVFGMRLVFG